MSDCWRKLVVEQLLSNCLLYTSHIIFDRIVMSKHFDILGIGNGIVDLQIKIRESEFSKLGLVKGAMRLVDIVEQERLVESFGNHELHRASGGSVANSVIALAQLGGKAAFQCALGGDNWGAYYKEEMSELGIECGATSIENAATGTSVVLITPDAERTMNTHLGASFYFGHEHLSKELIRDSKWLLIEGYLLTSPDSWTAVTKSIRIAKEFDTKIAITASAKFITEAFHDKLAEVIDASDLAIANAEELMSFTKTDNEDEAFRRMKKILPNFVMTLRERGVRLCFNGEDHYQSSPYVTPVDETGAGDMFAGAFLYGITHGLPLNKVALLSCGLASQLVTHLGPRYPGDLKELADKILRH